MRSTFARLANFGTQFDGYNGLQPWTQMPKYDRTYQSKYGPSYKIAPNFHGISIPRFMKFGMTAAGFGGVAGVFAVFFFGDIPRIREDILQKVPVLGDYFVKEIAPEDNPF